MIQMMERMKKILFLRGYWCCAALIMGLAAGGGCANNAVIQESKADKSTFISDAVSHFADGDSMTLQHMGRVRLAGVDCPEWHQRGGKAAAAFTKRLLKNKTVRVDVCEQDPADMYGRDLVFMYYTDAAGKQHLLNTKLLSAGYARVYENTPCLKGLRQKWKDYYAAARQNRRGLFATEGEVPDGKRYRRQHSR